MAKSICREEILKNVKNNIEVKHYILLNSPDYHDYKPSHICVYILSIKIYYI